MSWVITGQSLSLVVGVPIVTLLGTLGGWRYALGIHGAFTVLYLTALAHQGKGDAARARELAVKAANANILPLASYAFVRAKARKLAA